MSTTAILIWLSIGFISILGAALALAIWLREPGSLVTYDNNAF